MKAALVEKIIATNRKSTEEIFEERGRIYTFLNPVSYIDAQKEQDLFGKMDGIFADGALLVKAIGALYGKKIERRSLDMTSLGAELLEYADRSGRTIHVVASRQEEGERAMAVFRQQYPNVGWSYRNGYFADEAEEQAEIDNIVARQPDYVLAGMGAIRQERFLVRLKAGGYEGIGLTCGGFFHQTAAAEGAYYPKWVDRMNLRFAYRMYREPHTRGRYLKAGIVFPIRFVKERFF